jgi:hypothetical protein
MKITLLDYFEKSPIVIYNELFVHILGFMVLMTKQVSMVGQCLVGTYLGGE